MQEQNDDRSTFWMLLTLLMRVKPRLLEIADHHGLTVQQINVLGALGVTGSQPMSYFAKILVCDASNITGIIDRLVHMEIVTRHECPTDRRIKNVALTPKGQKLYDVMMDELTTSEQSNLDHILNKTEQVEFRRLLIKVLEGGEQLT